MAAIVTTVENIQKHPNANSLDLATVLGWQLVVRSETHCNGDKVVYFEPYTVIPESLAESTGIKHFLSSKIDISGSSVLFIKQIKLRGEPSFGMCLPMPPDLRAEIGDDVSEYFGVYKFEPPIKFSMGKQVADVPGFPKYSAPENLRSSPRAFEDGQRVYVFEKIHGTNARFGWIRNQSGVEYFAGSKNFLRAKEDDARYWHPLSIESVRNMLSAFELYNNVQSCILYGELYGPGIQTYTYGAKTLSYVAFDLMVNGHYLDAEYFMAYCDTFQVPRVPLVGVVPYSLEAVKELSKGPSLLGGNHPREGVVVRPENEYIHPKYGRCIMKYVSDHFLFGEGDVNNFTDV